MTSWDALEAYLLDLVRKVGGVAYVLRDSGGRHLAPRPPPPVDRRAVLDEAIRKRLIEDLKGDERDERARNESLERILDKVKKRLGRVMEERSARQAASGDGASSETDPVQMALNDRARALARYDARIKRFEPHSAVLDEAVGVDFVRKGPGKRYLHRAAELPFIAERFLSSYLLIIAFRDVDAVDAQGVVLTLERARSVLSDMLGGLPPDDGGDRAIAHSQRPA